MSPTLPRWPVSLKRSGRWTSFVLSNPTTGKQWESYGEEGQRKLVEGIALRRLGTAQDIANGVKFFVSDDASWITGQVISIDGGHALF